MNHARLGALALITLAGLACSAGAQGLVSGHDGNKFTLNAPDGSHKLSVGGRIQFRYTFNSRDEDTVPPASGHDDTTAGFDMPRTRLDFRGTSAGGLVDFRITGNFSRSGGDFDLTYAYMDANLSDAITIRWGLDKAPVLREELMSSSSQLAVERTVVNGVFSPRFTEGVYLHGTHERFRWSGSVTDGANAARTPFFSSREADLALSGRTEFRLGDAGWSQYKDFTSWRGNDTGLMLGAAAHWETRGDTAAFSTPPAIAQVAVPDSERFIWTLDASFETDGWNLFGAFIGRRTDAAADLTDLGAIVQGGVFVTDHVELFGRWDAVFPDDDRGATGNDFHTLTGGFNYYPILESHAIKLTGDVQVFLDEPDGSSSVVRTLDAGTALLPGDRDNQVAVRLQVQVLF